MQSKKFGSGMISRKEEESQISSLIFIAPRRLLFVCVLLFTCVHRREIRKVEISPVFPIDIDISS